VTSAIELLETRLRADWPAIRAARGRTERVIGELSAALSELDSSEFSVVVTGSLGRGEATEGSDADWFLLIDGASDPEHAIVAREIETRVRGIVEKDVGPTGTFGDIVASHELVHYIAGTRDSNENLTRRILLLSESRALTNPALRQRVIQNVLARYVIYDRPVRSRRSRQTVAHFLLNDVVRYWRTMATDYASKMWERQRRGWGIRNVKLRFSRKVLFVAGLVTALSGELFASPELREVESDDAYFAALAELIRQQTDVPPLELLARIVLEAGDDDVADAIFSSYDEFLGVLANRDARKALEAVQFDNALDEPAYAGLRTASQRFRDGVTRLFFDAHPKLPRLIRDFGVF
jgi:predicted nucleotidyltransferase